MAIDPADIRSIMEYCLQKKGAEEGYLFAETVLVYKVLGKTFAFLSLDEKGTIDLKCDPVRAVQLRDEWAEISPGSYMKKRHWNAIRMNGKVTVKMIGDLIDDSYALVVAGLPKKLRDTLA